MSTSTEVFDFVKRNPECGSGEVAKSMPAVKVPDVCAALTTLFKKGAVVRCKNSKGKFVYRDAAIPWPDDFEAFTRKPAIPPQPEVSTPPPPPQAEIEAVKPPTREIAQAPVQRRKAVSPQMFRSMERDAMIGSAMDFCTDLGRAMGDMILSSMMSRVHEGVASVFHEFEDKVASKFNAAEVIESISKVSVPATTQQQPSTPPSETPRKPKVLIIGVTAAQSDKIDREFGIYLKLSYWRVDQMNSLRSGGAACQQLRDMLKGAEYVFEMSRVTNEKIADIAKNVGVKPEWCTGGMPMLRDQLIGVYAAA